MSYYFGNENGNKQETKTRTLKGEPTIINGNVMVSEEQDRLYQVANKRNKIKNFIDTKVVSCKTYTQACNMINGFSHDASELDVFELSYSLDEKANKVLEDFATKKGKYEKEIERLNKEHYHESPEALKELNVQVENSVLQCMAQLIHNTDGNRRMLGNLVKNADRVQALALLKLSLLPQYKEVFTNKYKSTLLSLSKSKEQKEFETAIENMKEANRKEIGNIYKEGFLLRTAMKQRKQFS